MRRRAAALSSGRRVASTTPRAVDDGAAFATSHPVNNAPSAPARVRPSMYGPYRHRPARVFLATGASLPHMKTEPVGKIIKSARFSIKPSTRPHCAHGGINGFTRAAVEGARSRQQPAPASPPT
jgi:hypothetical protein